MGYPLAQSGLASGGTTRAELASVVATNQRGEKDEKGTGGKTEGWGAAIFDRPGRP